MIKRILKFVYNKCLIKPIHSYYNIVNHYKFWINDVSVGRNVLAFDRMFVSVKGQGHIVIGDNVILFSGGDLNPLSLGTFIHLRVENNSQLKIGNNVGISSSCIWCRSGITIGNNVKIGANCRIIDSDAHSLNYEQRRNSNLDQQNIKAKPIIIGNDVLIGASVVILKGVEIGDRCIIGAGSVVAKSIPSDCIAVGNPCKILKRKI